MRTLAMVVAVVGLVGCSSTLAVGPSNPKPNINLKKSNQSLMLKLGSGVQDAFVVPKDANGAGPIDVKGWAGTVTGAFAAGFETSFTMAADADLVLEVQEAGLGMNAGKAQVRYKAQLLDRSGKQLALTSGTAESKTACTSSDCTAAAASALETMFEEIAGKVFAGG